MSAHVMLVCDRDGCESSYSGPLVASFVLPDGWEWRHVGEVECPVHRESSAVATEAGQLAMADS